MKVHANAALGPARRLALVEAIESGMTLRAAAAALNVAPATAHRWWHRWRSASEEDRRRGSWLCDRSSRPHRQPRRLSAAEEGPILHARRETGLGPGRLAGVCRRPRSTVWKVLHRHGLSRRCKGAKESYRREEWSRPGALLHVDVARLARFKRPGHAVTGDRTKTGADKRAARGYAYLHCVIDDHSRYAYVEQHPDQGGATAAAVLERAIGHLAGLGLKPPEAVMSDNAFAYRRSNAFQGVIAPHGARHILIPPYTPRWNGKVERFIQTLKREWAYAHTWPDSAERARSMSSFLRYYNRRPPHSSLGDRPPISRVHNVRGRDN
ncbi:MAG TPA: IS481 family transposase [Solirubrobacterales bacterium]|jgi:transposase InsO family protein|nr:IS481 family transposase [Solirubrobacterales bacterium]